MKTPGRFSPALENIKPKWLEYGSKSNSMTEELIKNVNNNDVLIGGVMGPVSMPSVTNPSINRHTTQNSITVCGACCRPITDRFLLRVVNVSYHEQCLQCFVCGQRLHNTCFARDAKLFCRIDYDRLYVKKCLCCSERIAPEEMVMRALDHVFHLRCFICVVCGSRLQKGDQFVVKQGQLFCRPDYEKEVEMLQGFTQGDFLCDDLLPVRSHDGRRGPKRPRTILTTQQRRAFKASFEVSPKPCRKVRETLAKDTGLSVRIVQVWFQNQRAKMKKIQKKARQNPSLNNDSKDGMDDDKCDIKLKVKEEEQSPPGMNAYLNDSCSDTETGHADDMSGTAPQHFLNPNSVKQELPESEDSFFKSSHGFSGICSEAKSEPNFLSFPYSLSASEHLFLSNSMSNGVMASTGFNLSLNPIDRLYSMQNSYFCGEESSPLMEH